jgi:long-chain acyl-CoA synthetase
MDALPFIGSTPSDRPALQDDGHGGWLTYADVARLAEAWAGRLEGRRGLVFLYVSNDIASVAALMGSVMGGHAVALLDSALSERARAKLATLYHPNWVVDPKQGQFITGQAVGPVHPDLAFLLSTSGSTGSAKFVRLSRASLECNADGIARVLDIRADDVAAGHLPLHYSYGLSVLTSHFSRGARVRLTGRGITDREFWKNLRESEVTHFPGVPFHYRIMSRLGFDRLALPSLRTMTQAGGALEPSLRHKAYDFMHRRGGRFFVMYGQTEAAPRMTTLRHEDFPAAASSVGTPLPGCRIEVEDPDERGCGEVIFHGPNVMMGYAENRTDLARGNDMHGRLPTGDIGALDPAGRLTIVGRKKRMGKLHGLRINLDEVELVTNEAAMTAVTQNADVLTIHVASSGDALADQAVAASILRNLREQFTVPVVSYRVRFVPSIPRTDRGKVNYAALEATP